MKFLDARSDGDHFAPRLLDAHAILQAAPGVKHGMIGAVLPSGIRAAAHERKPDIHALGRIHFRRHHANDGYRTAMKRDRASDNLRVAVKGAVPQAITDDCEGRRAWFVFVFAIGPAELRLEPDRVEEIRGSERNGDPFRFTSGDITEVEGFDAGEREMLK